MTSDTFSPGPTPGTVRTGDGTVLTVPDDWVLLPPGDAALTRRVKAAGEHWIVQEKKGRKVFSGRMGTGSDRRANSSRTRSRKVHRRIRQTQRG